MMNRVKVVICGKTYTIQTEESPSYLVKVSKELDKRINDFMDQNESASVTTAAVMVALELMDESAKNVADVDHIRAQIKGYVEEASKAQRELAQLKKENEELAGKLEESKA